MNLLRNERRAICPNYRPLFNTFPLFASRQDPRHCFCRLEGQPMVYQNGRPDRTTTLESSGTCPRQSRQTECRAECCTHGDEGIACGPERTSSPLAYPYNFIPPKKKASGPLPFRGKKSRAIHNYGATRYEA